MKELLAVSYTKAKIGLKIFFAFALALVTVSCGVREKLEKPKDKEPFEDRQKVVKPILMYGTPYTMYEERNAEPRDSALRIQPEEKDIIEGR